MRRLPDDNLAYPVLIQQPGSTGTGFFTNDGNRLFLVTAAHVLFDRNTGKLFGTTITLTSASSDPKEKESNVLELEASAVLANIKIDKKADVAVILLAQGKGEKATLQPGFKHVKRTKKPLLSANVAALKTYDDVLLGNEVYIMGYPVSLALMPIPQIARDKPLLRSGIVAGSNDAHKTIILDSAAYGGNSGGPVIEVDEERTPKGTMKHFRIIGVVIQFVPYAVAPGMPPVNSGYAVAASMDRVLELMKELS